MNKKQLNSLRDMVDCEIFDINYIIIYLDKYHKNKDVIKILMNKLNVLDNKVIQDNITQLSFFNLLYHLEELTLLLLEKCSKNFSMYFLISTTLESWGNQYTSKNSKLKKKTINLLEDCESSYVNGSIYNNTNKTQISLNSEKDIFNFVLGKKAKNDFKDNTKKIIFKLSNMTKKLLTYKTKFKEYIVKKFLKNINTSLIKRRKQKNEMISNDLSFLYEGLMMNFKNHSNSWLIVRFIPDEVQCFPTKTKIPFLIFFETIE